MGPDRDLAWAEAVLSEHGFRQVAEPEQIRTWNLSSLWRIPVKQESLWLKCVPPFFQHEGSVLERLQGGPVPRLVAHEGGRVLMREVPGEDQYDATLPTLLRLVSMLVEIQSEWAREEDALFSLGLPDWRSTAITEAVGSVVHRTASELASDDRRTLHQFLEGPPRRFAELAACGIPDSLVHGGFAPGNARGDKRELVLLDWGDCGVGHPLLDQSAFIDRIPGDLAPVVQDHWKDLRRRAIAGSDPERAAGLVAPVAAAGMAVIYQGFLDHIEPSEHPYHRHDPVTWLTRAAERARSRP